MNETEFNIGYDDCYAACENGDIVEVDEVDESETDSYKAGWNKALEDMGV